RHWLAVSRREQSRQALIDAVLDSVPREVIERWHKAGGGCQQRPCLDWGFVAVGNRGTGRSQADQESLLFLGPLRLLVVECANQCLRRRCSPLSVWVVRYCRKVVIEARSAVAPDLLVPVQLFQHGRRLLAQLECAAEIVCCQLVAPRFHEERAHPLRESPQLRDFQIRSHGQRENRCACVTPRGDWLLREGIESLVTFPDQCRRVIIETETVGVLRTQERSVEQGRPRRLVRN